MARDGQRWAMAMVPGSATLTAPARRGSDRRTHRPERRPAPSSASSRDRAGADIPRAKVPCAGWHRGAFVANLTGTLEFTGLDAANHLRRFCRTVLRQPVRRSGAWERRYAACQQQDWIIANRRGRCGPGPFRLGFRLQQGSNATVNPKARADGQALTARCRGAALSRDELHRKINRNS